MKKLISFMLALVLVMSLAVAASADTWSNEASLDSVDSQWPLEGASLANISEEQNVQVKITGTVNPVYQVTISWTDLQFECILGGLQWDPENHTYTNYSQNPWAVEPQHVTIANDSNEKIYYKATVTDNSATDNIELSLKRGDEAANTTVTGSLESAELNYSNNPNGRPTDVINVVAEGVPTKAQIQDSYQVVGKVTVIVGTSAIA